MGNELADALRRFADEVEGGKQMPGATQCAIVLMNDAGQVSATYIGNKTPARDAGLVLLGAGVQRFVVGMTPAAPPSFSATRGSTH